MNAALNEYLDIFVTAYLDDVLVYSKGSLKEHKKYVKKVLYKLREYKLFISRKKTKFYVTCTKYLRFILERDKIVMDLEKTAAVRD
jgi:hypothetical protein